MNDLTGLLERVTDDLHPDVTTLVAGATTRGRRLRTRRRLATGLGVVAAAGVIGVVAVATPALIGDGATPEPSVASRPAVTQSAAPADLPSLAALRDGGVVALPVGEARLLRSWGRESQGFVAATWSFTPADGSPAGAVSVLVEKVGVPDKDRAATIDELQKLARESAAKASAEEESCEVDGQLCADGSTSTFTSREPMSGGGDSDIIGAHADVWTDGLHLSASAYNAMGEKAPRPTRATPVLSEAQLLAMLQAAHLG
jgi:hypothetical protein